MQCRIEVCHVQVKGGVLARSKRGRYFSEPSSSQEKRGSAAVDIWQQDGDALLWPDLMEARGGLSEDPAADTGSIDVLTAHGTPVTSGTLMNPSGNDAGQSGSDYSDSYNDSDSNSGSGSRGDGGSGTWSDGATGSSDWESHSDPDEINDILLQHDGQQGVSWEQCTNAGGGLAEQHIGDKTSTPGPVDDDPVRHNPLNKTHGLHRRLRRKFSSQIRSVRAPAMRSSDVSSPAGIREGDVASPRIDLAAMPTTAHGRSFSPTPPDDTCEARGSASDSEWVSDSDEE